MTPEQIADITHKIASLMFSQLVVGDEYIIINDGMADPFNFELLKRGEGINLISHDNSTMGLPIRDRGIYHVTPDGDEHMAISEGWVDYLVTSKIAKRCRGYDLSVLDIYKWAIREVEAFQAAEPPSGPPTT